MIKIAIDAHVPTLRNPQEGLEVVYEAQDGEDDEEWIDTAIQLGAECVVTKDWGAGEYARSHGLLVIDYPQGYRNTKAWEFIFKHLPTKGLS